MTEPHRYELHIPSNDGWEFVRICMIKSSHDPELFHCDVVLTGNFWDREEIATKHQIEKLVRDYEVHLPQVLLYREALIRLRAAFELWLARYEAFSVRLVDSGAEQTEITVQPRNGSLLGKSKPVLFFRHSTTRFTCRTRFVIDESCIRIAHASLTNVLFS